MWTLLNHFVFIPYSARWLIKIVEFDIQWLDDMWSYHMTGVASHRYTNPKCMAQFSFFIHFTRLIKCVLFVVSLSMFVVDAFSEWISSGVGDFQFQIKRKRCRHSSDKLQNRSKFSWFVVYKLCLFVCSLNSHNFPISSLVKTDLNLFVKIWEREKEN